LALLFELSADLLHKNFIWFFRGCLLNNLVHLHKTLSPDVDLIKDILFHADVVGLVLTKQRAVRANPFFAVNANNFNLSFVQLTQIAN
jgi:hypothetical protein